MPALKQYADRNGIDGTKWHLLTGSRQTLYNLCKNSYFLTGKDDAIDGFGHTGQLVLVDQNRIIRRYYNGTDSIEVKKLEKDMNLLLNEAKEN